MHLQAKCLGLQTVLELTLKNHFSSPVFFCFNILLVPFQVLLFLGGVRNRLFSLSLFQNGGQEIVTILFHTFMTCHVEMTYALQQEVLPSGSQFVLSRIAIPKPLYAVCITWYSLDLCK